MARQYTARERFQRTMNRRPVDRPPYFEEGIRPEVFDYWIEQGDDPTAALAELAPADLRPEIQPDLWPRPKLEDWPTGREDLGRLIDRLDPTDPDRLGEDWSALVRVCEDDAAAPMIRVTRGCFQALGIYDWDRFYRVMVMFLDRPEMIERLMAVHGEFIAALADRALDQVRVTAAVFNEPIGGTGGPLISPAMYKDLILPAYEPVKKVLTKHGVKELIFRTYANARALIPDLLDWGFTCLWACEVDLKSMNYADLRREFGADLNLIGGIDIDLLFRGREAVEREVTTVVPPLLDQGGYIPLADGRLRTGVPLADYVYYRRLLHRVMTG